MVPVACVCMRGGGGDDRTTATRRSDAHSRDKGDEVYEVGLVVHGCRHTHTQPHVTRTAAQPQLHRAPPLLSLALPSGLHRSRTFRSRTIGRRPATQLAASSWLPPEARSSSCPSESTVSDHVLSSMTPVKPSTPMASMKGRTGWCASEPTGSARRFAVMPAATATIPFPKVASANVRGSQSAGKPFLLCSATIHASKVDRRRAVLTPPRNRPSMSKKNAEESVHAHERAYVPQKMTHIFLRPCLSALLSSASHPTRDVT
jgi:hypothetical protein